MGLMAVGSGDEGSCAAHGDGAGVACGLVAAAVDLTNNHIASASGSALIDVEGDRATDGAVKVASSKHFINGAASDVDIDVTFHVGDLQI